MKLKTLGGFDPDTLRPLSTAEIYRQAAELRKHWPASRLRQQEGWQELEVVLAHQVTDHMVRRDGESEARK